MTTYLVLFTARLTIKVGCSGLGMPQGRPFAVLDTAGADRLCTLFCFLLSGDDRPACSVGTRMGFDSKSPGMW